MSVNLEQNNICSFNELNLGVLLPLVLFSPQGET